MRANNFASNKKAPCKEVSAGCFLSARATWNLSTPHKFQVVRK